MKSRKQGFFCFELLGLAVADVVFFYQHVLYHVWLVSFTEIGFLFGHSVSSC